MPVEGTEASLRNSPQFMPKWRKAAFWRGLQGCPFNT